MRPTHFVRVAKPLPFKFSRHAKPLAWAPTIAGLLIAAAALPVHADTRAEAQARYSQDRTKCMSGASNQDQATCMIEARASLREGTQGRLTDSSAGQKDQNNLARCDLLPAADRDDCIRRMHGEGITSGSAADGGIYREISSPAVPQAAR